SARATEELRELHQFTDTLQSQLDDSARQFAEVMKAYRNGKIAASKRKTWEAFDQRWLQLMASLTKSFSKWTTVSLSQEYFYGVLYQLTQQAGQAVDLVHRTQQAYLAPNADRKLLDGQLSQSSALAGSALANLRAKVDQAEKTPRTANGMPR